jgi:DNA primase
MDAASEIRERLAIEDIVGEYVQLKRSGRNFKGLSPFSNEKTPSLMVSPEKQIWHDFSSGKGGNVFGFVMEVEGLDFKGALELLARKAGVDLAQYRGGNSNTSKLKERLHAALEAAAHFYQVQLTKHTAALNYVRKERAFTKETIIAFRLGYSPSSGKTLFDYLVKKGFTTDEMKRAGLITQRRDGWGDMFRGRLMVPLADAQGVVVGFTARQLESDPNAPKYINTPATLLYDKGRQAYGLHLAKEAIRKEGFVVVVEGNLDVIASHQAGVRNVVATAGTAMTVYHLKTLKRFTGDVRLCFDQDAAGQKAAERAIDLAVQADVTLQMVTIPEGKDPDELIKKDVELWKGAVMKPQYVIDWLMARYEAELDLASAVGKRTYSDVVMRLVKRLKDSVEQDHYITVLAKKIEVSPDSLRKKLLGSEPAARLKRSKSEIVQKSNERERIILEQHLLAIALRHPSLRPMLAGLPHDVFVQPEALQVHIFLLDHPDYAGASGKELKNIEDYVKMLVLLSEELYQHTEAEELRYQTEQLASRLVAEYAKHKKHLLAEAINTADEMTTAGLLVQAKELDELARMYRPD